MNSSRFETLAFKTLTLLNFIPLHTYYLLHPHSPFLSLFPSCCVYAARLVTALCQLYSFPTLSTHCVPFLSFESCCPQLSEIGFLYLSPLKFTLPPHAFSPLLFVFCRYARYFERVPCEHTSPICSALPVLSSMLSSETCSFWWTHSPLHLKKICIAGMALHRKAMGLLLMM